MDGKFILLCLLSLISLRMSLPVFVYCWDKQIPVWLVASLSTSLLNKTCAPHAAALCCLQIYSPFFFLADVSQFICCLLSPPAPPPQWVSLPLVSLSFLLPASSLLHLITLAFPGNRHRTVSGWLRWARSQSALGNTSPHPFSLYSTGRRSRRSVQEHAVVFAATHHISI